jgi:SSS family solute:Na+ symporter
MTPLLAAEVPTRLVRLAPIDVVIVVFYFALVLSIGWYLKGRANTGEDFFMAGRLVPRNCLR